VSSGVLTRGASRGGRREPIPAASMDPRLRARRIEVARDLGRRRLRRAAVLGVLAALVAGGVGVTRSPLLDVDRVQVRGGSRSGADAVRAAVGIPDGRAMVSVDPVAAVGRLERLPWVERATVVRSWPSTVVVRLVERTPVAELGDGADAVLVDRSGRVLGPAADADRLPSAGPAPVAGPGDRVVAARRPLVRVLADLPPEVRRQVDRGVLTGEGIGLVLTDGIRVRLCDGRRLGAKADALGALLEQADRSTIDTIDLCVPTAAALTRSTGGGA
jgi:cell division protein FtsQ